MKRKVLIVIAAMLDISSLPSGTYLVRVRTTGGTAYKKLVVAK